ncbi:MAG: DUF2817 domain-containing protein [Planctomycetes bacterium]|nr:DUF2817 domain-containing protein [Planctomycetota bacterium]
MNHRILSVLVCGVLLGETGCARLYKVRQRIFQHDTAVTSVELGESPLLSRGARAAPGLRRGDLGLPGSSRGQVSAFWQTIGHSAEGRPIETARFGSGPRGVLLIGAIHGDEPEGLPVIERLADELASGPARAGDSTVVIIRNLNPDGTATRRRTSARGVDLNRNLPASNWDTTARSPQFNPGPRPGSEPETQVLLGVLREFAPRRILVMHATRSRPMVNYDGPARELAEAMSQLNGYVTSDTIGYPTPGSLGSYTGIDLQIPIITLELPRGITPEAAWQANREALYRLISD